MDHGKPPEASCRNESQHPETRQELLIHQRTESYGLERGGFSSFHSGSMPRKVGRDFAEGWSQLKVSLIKSDFLKACSEAFILHNILQQMEVASFHRNRDVQILSTVVYDKFAL